jgi:hypothetical protein
LQDWGETSFSMKDAFQDIYLQLQSAYPSRPIATSNIGLFDLETQLRQNECLFKYSGESYDVRQIQNEVLNDYAGRMMTSLGQKHRL